MEFMERLRKLRLTTLETSRKRGYLIHFYKIVYGLDHIKWKKGPEKLVQGDKNGPAARNLIYVIVGNLRIYVHPGMSSF